MADYDLYYWPVPFRGQFVRAILAHAGKRWTEHDADAIGALMSRDPARQPVAFMGPPVLIDKAADVALAQTPAIALYLGETLGLIDDAPAQRARTAKIVNDANDVIDELTLNGGRQMWTKPKWKAFVPRLEEWMAIWETEAARHGVTDDAGWLLGAKRPGVADIVTTTLWSTMTDRLPPLRAMLDATAPRTAALCRRLQETPPLKALAKKAEADYGDAYCGGEIEKSLRAVVGGV